MSTTASSDEEESRGLPQPLFMVGLGSASSRSPILKMAHAAKGYSSSMTFLPMDHLQQSVPCPPPPPPSPPPAETAEALLESRRRESTSEIPFFAKTPPSKVNVAREEDEQNETGGSDSFDSTTHLASKNPDVRQTTPPKAAVSLSQRQAPLSHLKKTTSPSRKSAPGSCRTMVHARGAGNKHVQAIDEENEACATGTAVEFVAKQLQPTKSRKSPGSKNIPNKVETTVADTDFILSKDGKKGEEQNRRKLEMVAAQQRMEQIENAARKKLLLQEIKDRTKKSEKHDRRKLEIFAAQRRMEQIERDARKKLLLREIVDRNKKSEIQSMSSVTSIGQDLLDSCTAESSKRTKSTFPAINNDGLARNEAKMNTDFVTESDSKNIDRACSETIEDDEDTKAKAEAKNMKPSDARVESTQLEQIDDIHDLTHVSHGLIYALLFLFIAVYTAFVMKKDN